MTNLATGKQFPDGGKMVSRRDFGRGLAAIFAAGVAPSLLGQTARGIAIFAIALLAGFSAFASTARGLMHRNLGGRLATSATVEKAENKIVVAIPAGATSGLSVNFYCDRPATAQVVDWGDGTTTSVIGTSASHTYATSGTYNITWPDALLNVTARGTPYITSANWKDSRTFMRNSSFDGCTSLASVGDLSSCSVIGSRAFYGCTSLASVDLSSCVIVQGLAFGKCENIVRLNLSKSCKDINDGRWDGAFGFCTSLVSVGDISCVTNIGDCAFRDCHSITSMRIDACERIGVQVFYNCTSLASVGDLSACTSIEGHAFTGCTSITSLTFASRTHTEVEAITGFSNFPNRGTACVFHCSDGDFYRSGSSLLPMP